MLLPLARTVDGTQAAQGACRRAQSDPQLRPCSTGSSNAVESESHAVEAPPSPIARLSSPTARSRSSTSIGTRASIRTARSCRAAAPKSPSLPIRIEVFSIRSTW